MSWRMLIRTLLLSFAGLVFALALPLPLAAQLRLSPEDLRIDQSTEGGYIIRLRAEGIGSVLLTESTADPSWQEASYTYRNPDFHPMNGNEPRLDPAGSGEFMEPDPRGYYIIDSSPEPDPELGQAFKLFVPYLVNYGFPWTRNGVVQVLDGTYLSIRAFSLPYADYGAAYQDNPFILRVVQLAAPEIPADPLAEAPTVPEPEEDLSAFMGATVSAFRRAAQITEARVQAAMESDDLPAMIANVLDQLEGKDLDLVIVLDTSQSMQRSLEVIKQDLVHTLRPLVADYERINLGFVVFRDYFDEYLNRPYPMVSSLEEIQQYLNRARAAGGRDIPEAVYEALYAALTHYEWKSELREIILIGDAPPHPLPRAEIDEEMVYARAKELGVRINTIMLPHP